MDRFKQTLQTAPKIPRPITDSDAVAVLMEICVQRKLPIPSYDFLKLF